MVLGGADILFYPTAIGSEPLAPDLDTRDPWQRVMQGHAVANCCALVAANRVGKEADITFYGSSFVSNHRGDKLAELSRTEQGVASATIDLEALVRERAAMGFFRDRRPDLYASLAETQEEEN
jgi:N-carbamoylputrescine amidase